MTDFQENSTNPDIDSELESLDQAPTEAAPRLTSDEQKQQARTLAVESARLLADTHCEDVIVFDVSQFSPVTDFVVIATGTSDRQVRSLGHHVTKLASEMGFDRMGTDQDGDYRWSVLDFGPVMAHLFEPIMRAHYDLEMLWDDAPRVHWRREASPKGSRAIDDAEIPS